MLLFIYDGPDGARMNLTSASIVFQTGNWWNENGEG